MWCLCKTVDHWTITYGFDKLGAVLSLKKSDPGQGIVLDVSIQ